MRSFIAGVLLIVASTANAATLYPCDIAPAPVLCYGSAKLASAYSGSGLDVYNPNTLATQPIGFTGAALDTAALDTFLAGQIGLVLKRYDQVGGKHLTQTVVAKAGTTTLNSTIVTGVDTTGLATRMDISGVGITRGAIISTIDGPTQLTMNEVATATGSTTLNFSEAPRIQALSIGGARSIVFQGESQSGALFSLVSPDISSLGITAKDYSVLMVVQQSSSIFCNQAGAPDISSGALFDLQGSGGTVAQLLNDSALAVRGGWQVTDGTFDFVSPQAFVQVNPIVIGITSDSTGVKVYQNGQIRATASRSALTRTAATLYLGKLAASVAGGTSQAGGYATVAELFYSVGLTQAQYAFVSAALYERFSIDPRLSTFSTNQVAFVGESIVAGFKTLGIYGYANYLQALATKPARILNFAVPGSTLTQNPAGGPAYRNTTGLFPLAVSPQLAATVANKGRVVVIGDPGANDLGLGPTPRAGTLNTSTLIDGIADTSDLTVGDYANTPCSSAQATILSKTANSITISAATTCSGATVITFTYANKSPAVIHAAIASLVAAASAAGATKVVVSTILKQNNPWAQPYISAVNVLINGGVAGATVVDCAAFPGLDTNPGPSYADSAHLTALGHQQMAACLQAEVNSGLQN